MLALCSLSLSHFRSHKQTRLDLPPGPIAIYGPNGAGKTNILEAVSLLSPGRGLRGVKASDMARAPERLGWKIKAQLQSLGQLHEIETAWTGPNSGRSVTIDDKAATQSALGQVARMVWLVPVMDRLWVEGAEGRRRFLDRMTLSFEPNHAQLSLDYAKAMAQRNRLLKDQVRNPSWYDALEHQMAQTGAQIMAHRAQVMAKLIAAQSSASAAFPVADLALSHVDGEDLPDTADDLQELFASSRAQDAIAGRALVGPHRIDMMARYKAKDMVAKDCSTGEQKALLVSLILANSRALAAELAAPPILLLDEVAAHLDEDRRSALYAEITSLKAQAFMTGTGPELFDALGDLAHKLRIDYKTDGSTSVSI